MWQTFSFPVKETNFFSKIRPRIFCILFYLLCREKKSVCAASKKRTTPVVIHRQPFTSQNPFIVVNHSCEPAHIYISFFVFTPNSFRFFPTRNRQRES